MGLSPKIDLEVAPFQVPTAAAAMLPSASARRLGQTGPAILLGDLPENVLSELCDRFRYDVFKAAGKEDSRANTKSLDPTLNLGVFLADLRRRMESREDLLGGTDINSLVKFVAALYA